MAQSSLDKFGEFVITNFRDKAIQQHLMLQHGELRSKPMQELHAQIEALTPSLRSLIMKIVVDAIDTALHDILFAMQDAYNRQLGIEVLVDGRNVAEESEMLNGEIQGDLGWITRFSKFKGQGKNELCDRG